MPPDLTHWALPAIVAGVIACAAAIAGIGPRLAALADRIGAGTGMGHSLAGAVLLGAATSLPGIVTSVTAAAQGLPQMAISNAVGGIAVQTAFLGIADIAYRRANLEHAAASVSNLAQAALLIALLAVPLAAMAAPDASVLAVDPTSVVLLAGFVLGIRLAHRVRTAPMWAPAPTDVTDDDQDDAPPPSGTRPAILPFLLLAVGIGAAGFGLAVSAAALADRTGLSQTAVGGLLTAVVTSLPELVTSVAAVRRGAINLAVGGILGGNAFDVLFLAFADIAYREGSIFQVMVSANAFVIAVTIVMIAILMLGLLRRERHGVAGIGFESNLVLALYGLSAVVMATA